MSGGLRRSPPGSVSVIDSFPFLNPFTTASSIGNLAAVLIDSAGNSSDTNGYVSGGRQFTSVYDKSINRFPFTAPFTTATDIGDLSVQRRLHSSSSSSTNGYASAGYDAGPPTPTFSMTDRIDRFPFSSPFTTATDVGDIGDERHSGTGHSSSTDGWHVGGAGIPNVGVPINSITRYPFSSPFTTATNVATITPFRQIAAGTESDTDGFVIGGYTPIAPGNDTAYRFPFSSPFAPAVSIGELGGPTAPTSFTINGGMGMRSDSNGHIAGFSPSDPTPTSRIERFPFSSPFFGGTTNIGSLSVVRTFGSGHQG
jgi:hypothetical protein